MHRSDGYLFVPPTYIASKSSPLLVMLHGAGKRAQDALETLSSQDAALLAGQRALLLIPESRGGTWDLVMRYGWPALRMQKNFEAALRFRNSSRARRVFAHLIYSMSLVQLDDWHLFPQQPKHYGCMELGAWP